MCFQKWCLLACSMNLSMSSLLVSHSVLLNLLPLNYWLEYLDLLSVSVFYEFVNVLSVSIP